MRRLNLNLFLFIISCFFFTNAWANLDPQLAAVINRELDLIESPTVNPAMYAAEPIFVHPNDSRIFHHVQYSSIASKGAFDGFIPSPAQIPPLVFSQ